MKRLMSITHIWDIVLCMLCLLPNIDHATYSGDMSIFSYSLSGYWCLSMQITVIYNYSNFIARMHILNLISSPASYIYGKVQICSWQTEVMILHIEILTNANKNKLHILNIATLHSRYYNLLTLEWSKMLQQEWTVICSYGRTRILFQKRNHLEREIKHFIFMRAD